MNPWNARFQDENYIYGTEPNVFLAETQKRLQLSGDALAIAEGEGRNAVFLAEQGMNVTTELWVSDPRHSDAALNWGTGTVVRHRSQGMV